jgi:hypothetical protein
MSTLDTATIRSLRSANSIVFRWGIGHPARIEGQSPGGARIIVKTAAPKLAEYGDGAIASACWAFSSAQWTPALVTFLSLLRPGDEIRPIFTADNSSSFLREAGVTVDEMAVEIVRPRKNKPPLVLHFALDTQAYLPRLCAYPNFERVSA